MTIELVGCAAVFADNRMCLSEVANLLLRPVAKQNTGSGFDFSPFNATPYCEKCENRW